MSAPDIRVLVVEDGDEYLTNFTTFVAEGMRYVNGDVTRARAFLQDNQGLFILRALRDAGYAGPVILSYDFGAEERRFRALSAKDPALSYCPDYADATTIRTAIVRALGGEEARDGR